MAGRQSRLPNTTKGKLELMSYAMRSYEEERITLLRILSQRRDAGWKRKGVMGWVFTDEIPDGVAGADLDTLSQSGLILREDVRDPGRRLPLYLNRITQRGEDVLAAADDRESGIIPAPGSLTAADRETIWMPAGAWTALQALKRQPPDRARLSIDELGRVARTTVYPEQLAFLIQRGLAEEHRPEVVSRASPIQYAATDRGRCSKRRGGNPDRVQVRVRGLVLRGVTA